VVKDSISYIEIKEYITHFVVVVINQGVHASDMGSLILLAIYWFINISRILYVLGYIAG